MPAVVLHETLLDQNPGEFRKRTGEEIEACALALDGMVRRANLGPSQPKLPPTRLQAPENMSITQEPSW
jgi:hypothetical protein